MFVLPETKAYRWSLFKYGVLFVAFLAAWRFFNVEVASQMAGWTAVIGIPAMLLFSVIVYGISTASTSDNELRCQVLIVRRLGLVAVALAAASPIPGVEKIILTSLVAIPYLVYFDRHRLSGDYVDGTVYSIVPMVLGIALAFFAFMAFEPVHAFWGLVSWVLITLTSMAVSNRVSRWVNRQAARPQPPRPLYYADSEPKPGDLVDIIV